MKKINEIFYSLQGEGRNAGKPAVFIRFSGCNLRCPFCDTQHETGKMISDEDIINEINKYPCDFIVLTGGEPSLFINQDFIDKLHGEGKVIAMETNGTGKYLNVDWLTISPKFEFTDNAEDCQINCDELKVVFNGENNMSLYDRFIAKEYYIQPCDTQDSSKNESILSKAVSFCLNNPKWKLSLQTQKILHVR